MNLNTESLHEQSAIEVQGVDLGALDNDILVAIRRLWQSHPLVLFRKQSLTEKDLVGLARSFGALHVPDRSNQATPRLDGVTYISNLKTEEGERLGGLGSAELDWHTDQSYRETPATGSIFYAIEMPLGVGKIQWCNTQLAYDALPARLQEQISSLQAFSRYNAYEREKITDEEKREQRDLHPPVSHPLVLTHPVSGQKCLYLDISTTYAVDGMNERGACSLLEELASIMTRPEFVYTHEWRPGDVMMWDNARLCHRRDSFDERYPRLAKRVSIFLDRDAFPCP
jgi:alpha-ketoglutarate-dependent taurine dioxygenase